MARIRVKRLYEPAAAPDGFRVLADRLWPRGVRRADARLDLWAKDVAPSTALRRWYSHDAAHWAEFKRRYRKELAGASALADLRAVARSYSVVTLLYAARSLDHNHALVLRDALLGAASSARSGRQRRAGGAGPARPARGAKSAPISRSRATPAAQRPRPKSPAHRAARRAR